MSPCKDCKKRKYLCHSNCNEYLTFKDELHTNNEAKKNENDYLSYKIGSINRMKMLRKK